MAITMKHSTRPLTARMHKLAIDFCSIKYLRCVTERWALDGPLKLPVQGLTLSFDRA